MGSEMGRGWVQNSEAFRNSIKYYLNKDKGFKIKLSLLKIAIMVSKYL